MWRQRLGIIAATAIATLVVANIIASIMRREERSTVPEALQGSWVDTLDESSMSIYEDKLIIHRDDRRDHFGVQAVVLYYEGPFLGYLFGQQKVAVECDKYSTDRDQAWRRFKAPKDYRKKFYFTLPDSWGDIEVDETSYSSRGWSESDGVYLGPVGLFERVSPQ